MMGDDKGAPNFWPGHLKGYYRGGGGVGTRAWGMLMDTHGLSSPSQAGDDGGKPESGSKERQLTDVELMRERFAKLLLGEDMSGGGKGVSSAMALSNAITNLAASVFGEQKRLEPMSEDTKARWMKEIGLLLSVTDYIVEFVPAKQRLGDGTTVEVMVVRQRRDLHLNIPALRKLDGMLLDCLDDFQDHDEFYYVSNNESDAQEGKDKWWIPTPKVPPNGLSDATGKWFLQQKDSVNQVLKAAMAINSQVLSEMEIPESYIESLPKNGRVALGDFLYKIITDEQFDQAHFLSQADLSTEHKIVDLENKLEASMVIWKRKSHGKDHKSPWVSVVSMVKREFIERAETILILLKHKFPGLPQTDLDISKIQCNWDVGLAILESYSRVIEGLAFTVLSRIEDVIQADTLARNTMLEQNRTASKEPPPVKSPMKPQKPIDDTSLKKPQQAIDYTSPNKPQNAIDGAPLHSKSNSSMTLMDFMGWTVDSKETVKETKNDIQDEREKKLQQSNLSAMRNQRLSYMQRLETSDSLRSPPPRD